MAATLGPKDKHIAEVHYVESDVPYVVEELQDCFDYEQSDLELSEILLQESLFQSLKSGNLKDAKISSSSSGSNVDRNHGQSSSGTHTSLNPAGVQSQLTEDEILARDLQEMENQLALSSLTESSKELDYATSTTEAGSTSTGTSELALPEDDIDPDSMTYEELQSLGDTIGVESKGLSDDIISDLPTYRYKTGIFSRKSKDQCVICYTLYKKGDVLMNLPCNHCYHSECISRWLKINKACPICNQELFG